MAPPFNPGPIQQQRGAAGESMFNNKKRYNFSNLYQMNKERSTGQEAAKFTDRAEAIRAGLEKAKGATTAYEQATTYRPRGDVLPGQMSSEGQTAEITGSAARNVVDAEEGPKSAERPTQAAYNANKAGSMGFTQAELDQRAADAIARRAGAGAIKEGLDSLGLTAQEVSNDSSAYSVANEGMKRGLSAKQAGIAGFYGGASNNDVAKIRSFGNTYDNFLKEEQGIRGALSNAESNLVGTMESEKRDKDKWEADLKEAARKEREDRAEGNKREAGYTDESGGKSNREVHRQDTLLWGAARGLYSEEDYNAAMAGDAEATRRVREALRKEGKEI